MCHSVIMTTPTPPKRWPSLLSVEQTAEMIDLNDQTVRTMLNKGTLRGRQQSSGAWVLSRSEVVIDIARHRQDLVTQRTGRGHKGGETPA